MVNGSRVLTHGPCDPSRFLDPFSPWSLRGLTHWPVICSYFAIACFGKRIRGVHPPKSRTKTQTPQMSHKNWGKTINKHINFMKICMIFVPLFAQDTPMEWTLLRVRWFSFFRKSRLSSQPETKQICHPFTWPQSACLLHLRNTSFASLLGDTDRRDLVGLIIRPD